MVVDDILELQYRQLGLRLQLQVLAEAVAAEVVHAHDMTDILIALHESHHRRSGEYDMQRGIVEETIAQLL